MAKPLEVEVPIYEPVGWITETKAAELKNANLSEDAEKFHRSTISRWRGQGYIQGFSILNSIVLVPIDQVKKFKGIPRGNPILTGEENYPDKVDPLPETITITFRLTRTEKKKIPSRSKKKS